MTVSSSPQAAPRLSLVDWWRREWFLQSLSLRLPNISQKDWRMLSRGLRTDLSDAAAHVGMRQAIDDLGPIDQLAIEYGKALDLSSRPQWITASFVTLIVWAVGTILLLTYAAGLYDGAVDGGITANISRNVLGVTVFANVGESTLPGVDSFGMIITPSAWIVPVFLLVLFLVSARAWRTIPALRPSGQED